MVPHLLPLVASAGCWLHSELTTAHIPVAAGDSGTTKAVWDLKCHLGC